MTGQHQAGVVVLVLIEILEHHNVSPQDHHPPAQIIQEYPCQIYQVGSQQQHSERLYNIFLGYFQIIVLLVFELVSRWQGGGVTQSVHLNPDRIRLFPCIAWRYLGKAVDK